MRSQPAHHLRTGKPAPVPDFDANRPGEARPPHPGERRCSLLTSRRHPLDFRRPASRLPIFRFHPQPGAGARLRHHEVRHKVSPRPEPQQRRHPCASLLPQPGPGGFSTPPAPPAARPGFTSTHNRREQLLSELSRAPSISIASGLLTPCHLPFRPRSSPSFRSTDAKPIKVRAVCLGHDRHSIPFCQGLSRAGTGRTPQSRGLPGTYAVSAGGEVGHLVRATIGPSRRIRRCISSTVSSARMRCGGIEVAMTS